MNIRYLEDNGIEHLVTMGIGTMFRMITDSFNDTLAPINTVCLCVGTVNDTYMMLFPNGNYDGFSPKEIRRYLRYLFNVSMPDGWKFTSVMSLTSGFQNGLFDDAFQRTTIKLTQLPYARIYEHVTIHSKTNSGTML